MRGVARKRRNVVETWPLKFAIDVGCVFGHEKNKSREARSFWEQFGFPFSAFNVFTNGGSSFSATADRRNERTADNESKRHATKISVQKKGKRFDTASETQGERERERVS